MELGVQDDCRSPSVVWHRSGDVAFVTGPSRVVLLHLDHVEVPATILEGTGAAIWHAVDGQRDQAALTATVASQFAVEAEFIRDDVAQFLDELRAAGFLMSLHASTKEI